MKWYCYTKLIVYRANLPGVNTEAVFIGTIDDSIEIAKIPCDDSYTITEES